MNSCGSAVSSLFYVLFKKCRVVFPSVLSNQVHSHVKKSLYSYVTFASPNYYTHELFLGCNKQQVRWYAARRGKQIKRKLEQRGRKKSVEKQPFIFPKFRVEAKKVIVESRRHNKDEHLFLPADDVFRTKFYKKIKYTTQEAIEMHRETHHPTIFNNPEAVLYVTIELDMCTQKKNRFLDNFSGILLYPHDFDSGVNRKVLALCKEASGREEALKAGAFLTGAGDIIRQLQVGDLTSDDFDYLVAHPDIMTDLVPLRGLLKRKFPTISNGALTADISQAVKRFHKGISYTSSTDEHYLDFGWVNVPVGKLNMPTEDLEENLETLLNAVDKRRPKGTTGPFIKRVLLLCPPTSREEFLILHEKYLPEYEEKATERNIPDDDEEEEAVEK